MSSANEQDVVIAFRQAVEEEMRKAQSESRVHDKTFDTDRSVEESLRQLRERHLELEREVALLRTIVLRLISDPVDEQ